MTRFLLERVSVEKAPVHFRYTRSYHRAVVENIVTTSTVSLNIYCSSGKQYVVIVLVILILLFFKLVFRSKSPLNVIVRYKKIGIAHFRNRRAADKWWFVLFEVVAAILQSSINHIIRLLISLFIAPVAFSFWIQSTLSWKQYHLQLNWQRNSYLRSWPKAQWTF